MRVYKEKDVTSDAPRTHPPFQGSDIRTASTSRRYGLVGIGSSTLVLYDDSLEPPILRICMGSRLAPGQQETSFPTRSHPLVVLPKGHLMTHIINCSGLPSASVSQDLLPIGSTGRKLPLFRMRTCSGYTITGMVYPYPRQPLAPGQCHY